MRKKLALVGGAALLLGLCTVIPLRIYSTEILHRIVVNAVAQRAPKNYPTSRIEQAFDRRLRLVQSSAEEEEYRHQLMRLSHRLEKIQHLRPHEIEEIISQFEED